MSRTKKAPKRTYQRITYATTDGCAKCWTCHPDGWQWFGPQAQGTAARHTDATGHKTHVEMVLAVDYTTPEAEAAEQVYAHVGTLFADPRDATPAPWAETAS